MTTFVEVPAAVTGRRPGRSRSALAPELLGLVQHSQPYERLTAGAAVTRNADARHGRPLLAHSD